MNAKEYLKQVRTLDIKIKNNLDEIKRLEYLATGLKGISYEKKEGAPGSPNTMSPQEKYIPRLLELKDELSQQVDQFTLVSQQALRMVNEIQEADCASLLYKRYFQYKKWEEIAMEMNYSYRWIIQLHGRALLLFDERLKKYESDY